MTNQQLPSFDLADQMIETLRAELGPDQLRKGLEQTLSNNGDSSASKKYFQEFGRRWMKRVIEEGEKHPDRTYECLKEANEKTGGALAFPYLSQRFIEIAYLGTQPIYTLPIVENSKDALTFKMPFCEYYKSLNESQGEEFVADLPCSQACEAAAQEAFEHFGYKVGVSWQAKMPVDGYCQVDVRRKA